MEIYKELEKLGFFEWLEKEYSLKDDNFTPEIIEKILLSNIYRTIINASAFKFFRDKYGTQSKINHWDKDAVNIEYWFEITYNYNNSRHNTSSISESLFNLTYEEAELACLRKLIEIVKQK